LKAPVLGWMGGWVVRGGSKGVRVRVGGGGRSWGDGTNDHATQSHFSPVFNIRPPGIAFQQNWKGR
jgi:hypothetical protein